MDTDEEYARLRAHLSGLEKVEKTVLAEETMYSDQKTLGLKEADARISPAYKEWRKKYKEAVYDFETIKCKRITYTLMIEVWRSELSARKQGMIV